MNRCGEKRRLRRKARRRPVPFGVSLELAFLPDGSSREEQKAAVRRGLALEARGLARGDWPGLWLEYDPGKSRLVREVLEEH